MHCPGCKAVTLFGYNTDYKLHGGHYYGTDYFESTGYQLLRCVGCSRGGFALLHIRAGGNSVLGESYPLSIPYYPLPDQTPKPIESEFREAEKCMGATCYRAASAMFRSTLEKILKSHGFTTGNMEKKVEDACKDGVLTESMKMRAHDEIRSIGNEVLHEEWKEVTAEDVEITHHYTQRVIEAFYDDPETVKILLISKGRMKSTP